MKSGIAILLVLFFCIACVHATPPTQSCVPRTSGSCGNMPNGNIYIYLNLPVSDQTVFMLGNDKMPSSIRSLPSPNDMYTGYQIGLVPGSYTFTVRRPGYNDAAFNTQVCDCQDSFVSVVMVPAVTTPVTMVKVGLAKTVASGFAGLPTTTTPASSGNFGGMLQAPTIAVQKATTTADTGGLQGSGSQIGGSGSQNTGTSSTGTGQAGSTSGNSPAGSSQAGSGSQQPGTAAAGGADTANTGSLSVTTTPAGVSIFIDGVQRGVSPATIPGLTPGDHTLLLKLDGYTDLSTPVSITAGKTTEYNTGLAKTAKSPGFEFILALAALGAVLIMRRIR